MNSILKQASNFVHSRIRKRKFINLRGVLKQSENSKNPKIFMLGGAAVLALIALIAGISITSSLFGVPFASSALGNFFADSYGILAFFIPAYLLAAAGILLDGIYRPARIFVLNCTIFPFITLAIGFSFLRDFEYFMEKYILLSIFGKHGFSFLIVLLTVMESIVIASISTIFFPSPVVRRVRHSQPVSNVPHPKASGDPKDEIKILRIPIENMEMNSTTAAQDPSLEVVKEAYTQAFEELEELRDANIDAVSTDLDAAFAKLHPNLDYLNQRLQNFDKGLAEIDVSFEKLDKNLGALENELVALNGENTEALYDVEEFEEPDELDEIEAAGDIKEIEEIEEIEETGGIEELDEIEEIETIEEPEETGGDDLERLIDEVEARAEENTAEVIKKIVPQKKKPIRYGVPVEGVLKEYEDGQYWIIDDATRQAAFILKETLSEFKIEAEVTGIRKGPVITMFEILPSPGVKLSKIVNLQDNIALRLAASSVRIVAPIPGKHAVGIEIPNKKRNIVSFREIIQAELQREGKKPEIPVVLGKDIAGEGVTVDLATMPHLLIAGSTGSGKSVCVNTMILSILYQCDPSKCRLILIDPKIVELKLYNDIPHLLTPVITEPKRAFQALQYCIYEMERRYACLDSMGVRDIKTYNKRIKERNIAAEHMPYIVVVIDEFADLMATTGKELESTVARLAAMSRAVGIHLVLATQRPSIDVITGLIKSNIPSRIAFMVASMMDSRIIIDSPGAEKLLGKGDMLYSGIVDPFPIRLQGAFVSEEEVEAVVDYVKTLGDPDYIDEEIFFDEDDEETAANVYTEGDDPLYDKALEIVVHQGKASASYIQRRLKIGYNRAARLVEEMEQRGVVGPSQGSKPRELLRAI